MNLIILIFGLISNTSVLGITVYLYKQLNIGYPISPTSFGKFDRDQPTFLLADGFTSNFTTAMINSTKKALYTKYFDETSQTIKPNILVLDWSDLNGHGKISGINESALAFIYLSAVRNVSVAGEALAEILTQLPTADFHLIGHSLGAHLIGYTGRSFNKKSPFKIRRGLDPAGPEFHLIPERNLKKGDGEFTEIYHTNGKLLGLGVLGTVKGDVNIYINGGQQQYGCDDYGGGIIDFLRGYCNHAFSYKFFVKSILEDGFGTACPCNQSATDQTGCSNPLDIDQCPDTIRVGYYISFSTTGDHRAVAKKIP